VELLDVKRRALLAALPSFVLAPNTLLAAPGASIQLAVIVGQSTALTGISFSRLKALFLGRVISSTSGRLMPFNRVTNTPYRVLFDQVVLEMDPDEAARYWVDRKIRGETGAPEAFETADQLKNMLDRVPNSVGYVDARDLGGPVRVIPVDGKMPGEPGYPVRILAERST
jgi:hypothetical protein